MLFRPSVERFKLPTFGKRDACVYIIKDKGRIAIAVHAYGGPVTNSGTRISAPVYQNLTNWKE